MQIKFRSPTTIFLHDLVMVALAWWAAYWLRFNFDIPPEFQIRAWNLQFYVVATQSTIFCLLGLYRGIWRFSSLPDLFRILKAVFLEVALLGVGLSIYNQMEGVPGAVLVLYVFVSLVLVSAPRFFYRFWKERVLKEADLQRALIVGAGVAGEMLVRDLQSDFAAAKYIPIAFVDDNPLKRRCEIRGVRVVGQVADIGRLVEELNIAVVLIAIPSATDAQMRTILEHCERSHVHFLTLPSLKEMLVCQVSGGSLRDVSIKDILGREPVRLNWTAISESLREKCILVTGGGGSIGSELCKQVARIKPKRLIIFDQSEFNLYRLDSELKALMPILNYEVILGDITDYPVVLRCMQNFQPDVIFHAAAYKHVPLLEKQVQQAVTNNIIGTKIVAEAAIACGVERFVLISTDKAVNPENVMGATKRAAEILCQHFNNISDTRFMTVRFGNVLDSAGSVVPVFRAQIQAGGPVTVTHREVSRYFMTIPEACQLIMKAETIGNGGEIFVLDMGEPIKIAYLAEQMILLSGKQPNVDIAIEYIGLRPGEKMQEELFYKEEALMGTGYEKLLLAKAPDYNREMFLETLEALIQACGDGDDARVTAKLCQVVPELQRSKKVH